uniref:Uncharacterized protein n=1 Tax=Octopus bimaculoides TaxID=37653 RepID=A0A0L8GJD7_OCTBM
MLFYSEAHTSHDHFIFVLRYNTSETGSFMSFQWWFNWYLLSTISPTVVEVLVCDKPLETDVISYLCLLQILKG